MHKNSEYPTTGVLNFVIVERDEQLIKINTELPWHLESIDGKSIFEIMAKDLLEFDAVMHV